MVSTYAQLQAHVADRLWRTDLTTEIQDAIQIAEAKFKRDHRVRKHADRGLITVAANGIVLPADLLQITSWYHDGPTYYGPIEIVDVGQIAVWKAAHGSTGIPQVAAIVDGTARFAPVPDASYSTYMTYWRTIQNLSDQVTTNWLLTEHPDVYIEGVLVEGWALLKDSTRSLEAEQKMEKALDQIGQATSNKHFGGAVGRQVPTIG